MLVSFPFHDLSTSAFGEEKKTTLLLRSFFNDPKALFWFYTCRFNFFEIKEYKNTRLKSFMILLFSNKHIFPLHTFFSIVPALPCAMDHLKGVSSV